MHDPALSRRDLLKGAASAAALLSWAPRLRAQAESARTPRTLAPGEKLNIACVGCGGKGATDIQEVSSENIVALCDVDWSRAKQVTQKFPQEPKYQDYRVMLREMDERIDAVTVTTPDHMHDPKPRGRLTCHWCRLLHHESCRWSLLGPRGPQPRAQPAISTSPAAV